MRLIPIHDTAIQRVVGLEKKNTRHEWSSKNCHANLSKMHQISTKKLSSTSSSLLAPCKQNPSPHMNHFSLFLWNVAIVLDQTSSTNKLCLFLLLWTAQKKMRKKLPFNRLTPVYTPRFSGSFPSFPVASKNMLTESSAPEEIAASAHSWMPES